MRPSVGPLNLSLDRASRFRFRDLDLRGSLRSRIESVAARPAAPHPTEHGPAAKPTLADYRGRVCVTRKNVNVSKVASRGFEAEFTHVGDRCSFETLIDSFALREPGLGALAEIIHDIDVKDGKFARAEAPGIAAMIGGIAVAHAKDDDRIELGSSIFDALLELYRRKRS